MRWILGLWLAVAVISAGAAAAGYSLLGGAAPATIIRWDAGLSSLRLEYPMAAVVSLIVVVTLGLLVTRIATVALTMTGMSVDHARFQARSAFTRHWFHHR